MAHPPLAVHPREQCLAGVDRAQDLRVARVDERAAVVAEDAAPAAQRLDERRLETPAQERRPAASCVGEEVVDDAIDGAGRATT